ncbi:MAG: T9SS type A sorting domain-containing protein [Deferribacteres bacterium]|nr:T9SS type A sorting domain-containing protein [candidate division KSB1 bacterium]MCB9504331.1 T9SS type A sorting domain-containing protein [Deferribacteres bacterium]
MRSIFYSFLLYLSLQSSLLAQVVTTIPQFATVDDSLIVLFHADRGSKGLMGYTGDVYAHTGYNTATSKWLGVIADWEENIEKAKLENIGTDLWKLVIGDVYAFYNASRSVKITGLSFVFRSATGFPSGREEGDGDIFLDFYEAGLSLYLASPQVSHEFDDPERAPVFTAKEDTIHFKAYGVAIGSQVSDLHISINGNVVAQTTEDSLLYDFIAADFENGFHTAKVVTRDTSNRADSSVFSIVVNPDIVTAPLPSGTVDGVNIKDNSVVFSLFAPFKDFVYVIGDFNDWKTSPEYMMKRHTTSPDQRRFWLELDGLDPNTEFAFQYYVDGRTRIADPYTQKILDPWNDWEISSSTYPGLRTYPTGKTSQIASTFKINQETYEWQAEGFTAPANTDLVIYELLPRDFVAAHDFSTIEDSLDYLHNLGVNAIELMPINEFEGNNSWGYNPSFYFAVDKYYGPANDLKSLVDAAHKRGMAVIIDMVLNHSYGQSPLVRLYEADMNINPWYNEQSNFENPDAQWGYDFNHESEATRAFVKRVLSYWLTEFQVDGFRLDFTKGFSNTYHPLSDSWGSLYDPPRIANLKRIAEEVWQVNPVAYMILEHLAENSEETELANYGMMMWGNMNYNYNEATMGYNESGKSNFSGASYQTRGWEEPHLVAYMESHDEERLMFKNLQYGNSSGDYSVKDMNTALDRMKLAGAFFFTIPGPKMIWQFGELGYDYSIDYNGRLGKKPIRWDYLQDEWRRDLYDVWSALTILKQHEAFQSTDFSLGVSTALKRIRIDHSSMDVFVIGNFDVNSTTTAANFQHAGTWYDYFTGVSVDVSDPAMEMTFAPGEFHIYTTVPLPVPETKAATEVAENDATIELEFQLLQNYPNPFNPETSIPFSLKENSYVSLKIYDLLGHEIRALVHAPLAAGSHEITWDGRDSSGSPVAGGVYFIRIQAREFTAVKKAVLLR